MPMIEGLSGDTEADAIMSEACATWAGEMISALQGGYVSQGEDPTRLLEAAVKSNGETYIATLTFSIRRSTETDL